MFFISFINTLYYDSNLIDCLQYDSYILRITQEKAYATNKFQCECLPSTSFMSIYSYDMLNVSLYLGISPTSWITTQIF